MAAFNPEAIADRQPCRLVVDDMNATIMEGMLGWLSRFAACNTASETSCGPAGGVIVVAERLVACVRRVCDEWNMSVGERDGQPGWRVLTVTGPELPVRALCATVGALRYHAVTVP